MRTDILEQARLIRRRMDSAASVLTDEEAVNSMSLYRKWKEGETVLVGDRKVFNDRLYKCLQEHTTRADWTPDATPSLWAVLDVQHKGTA